MKGNLVFRERQPRLPGETQEDEVVCAISMCVPQQELVEETRQENRLQQVIAATPGTWPP